MVKFGGHVEAIREGDLIDARLYLIPYNKMKFLIFEHNEQEEKDAAAIAMMMTHQNSNGNGDRNGNGNGNGISINADNDEAKPEEDFFVRLWKKALKDAEEDSRSAREEIWQTVFAGIAANDNDNDTADPLVRGAHPGNAIKLYVDLSLQQRQGRCGTEAQELLVRMKQVYRAASINSEGLRKIVKKSDKYRKDIQLSSKLLPLLYTSSLYSGQTMIQDGIGLLRELISGEQTNNTTNTHTNNDNDSNNDSLNGGAYYDDDDDDVHFKPLVKRNSDLRHQESVDIRMMELEWLKNLVQSIPPDELLPKLVSHRGFHHIKDRNDKRPVENSLSAYETAWTCGIELCECDIAMTKDEKLVLAHDENFERLSLDTRAANSKRKVSDLTFKELICMPLTNGVRPPLLIDVLRSASAISEKSKLIIEIKPGNEVSAFALARLLIRHPDLRSSVAMIMSFDAATMHSLRAELDRAALPDSRDIATTAADGTAGMPLHNTHRRVTSHDHFGTMSSGWLAGMGGGLSSPTNNASHASSIGLSISQMNLNNNNHASSSKLYRKNSSCTTSGDEKQAEDEAFLHSRSSSFGYNTAAAAAADHRSSFSMPKLMLLTVADPPKMACELQIQYNALHRVDHWLKHDDGILDGVYLQYEEEMMTPEGAAHLRQLSQRFLVGIWGYAEKDPDDFKTFEWLVTQGNCSFVNSDLPKHFRKELLLQNHRLPPRQK